MPLAAIIFCELTALILGWMLAVTPSIPNLAPFRTQLETRVPQAFAPSYISNFSILTGSDSGTNIPHSPGHVRCPACDAQRNQRMLSGDLARKPFRIVAPQWLDSRKPYVSLKTYKFYEYCLKATMEFFGDIPLGDIHVGHFVQYQTDRQEAREVPVPNRNGTIVVRMCQAHARVINGELNTVAQILKRASLWQFIEPHYEPLPLPKWTPPRVMNEEQEDRLFRIAAQHPEWAVAYYASSLSVNTAAAGKEIRNLRIENIRLEEHPQAPMGILFVPSDAVKNEYRARAVPLNERAREQAERLLERYFDICEKQGIVPEAKHFLIPYMKSDKTFDPTKPTQGWRTAWRSLTETAGLKGLRSYDLRHQAITKMLENPEISEETVKSIAGHVSKKIIEHYSHIRLAAKTKALGAIAPKHPVGSVSGKLAHVQARNKVKLFA